MKIFIILDMKKNKIDHNPNPNVDFYVPVTKCCP